ncbi:Calcineurin-like protein phosphoesterase [Euroglyphus maynei]|uniref:Serine/threonine-protein phosphatase n=1 Tax=Euroglyphus maynei TaxID=6958 RepID=A0A1Y3AZP8_EURMA|nr:Calcineurin-like protein phosphoesterase [Euroglyphus maynei]
MTILSENNKEKLKILRENPPFDQCHCMQLFRLQSPRTSKFVTRLTYFIELSKSDKFVCCQDNKFIKWISINQLLNNNYVTNLWGPELIQFCRQSTKKPIVQQIEEFSLERAYFFLPRDTPRNLEESILQSAHLTEKDVERLYTDFVEHCFPSTYQTFESFRCYMSKHGFDRQDCRLKSLFNAFNVQNNGFLSFHELLLGLATIEPDTVHGEWRARFIFRYYNNNGTGNLDLNEFKKMIIDMNQAISLSLESIDLKVKECLNEIGTKIVNGKTVITSDDFVQAIGSHRFRGTSSLCRSSKSLFEKISRAIAAKALKKSDTFHNIESIVDQFKGICLKCKEKQYHLASHSVKVDSNGYIIHSQTEQFTINYNGLKSYEMSAINYSKEFQFNMESSAPNLIIKLIREFHSNKGTTRKPKGLLQNDQELLWKLITALCNDMDLLLDNEDKCVRISSPCFVIGDIHGNLDDLLTMEQVLWKRIPCVGANFLFLGDYVDRGQWSIECCLYLMAFKILCPNKVTLLRGNHEVRSLQTFYTYKNECLKKYGQIYGEKIWESTNKIFDKLPISATIDNDIFCSHGGIPKNATTINEINQIDRKLIDPEKESSIAWEILWSDPCHNQQFLEICNFFGIDHKDTNGYLNNIKRGTAYQFNEFAATKFLHNNGLTHMIRAHEVPQSGYQFHFNGKCLTIFSCSHYCGNQNHCACVLIDQKILRIIRLDTYNNNDDNMK